MIDSHFLAGKLKHFLNSCKVKGGDIILKNMLDIQHSPGPPNPVEMADKPDGMKQTEH